MAYPPHPLMSTPSISIILTGPFTLSAGGRAPRKILEAAISFLLLSDTMTCLTGTPDRMTSLQRSSIACRGNSLHQLNCGTDRGWGT